MILKKTPPLPLEKLDSNTLHNIKAIFFDIDDTFSSQVGNENKILSEAYNALWKLHAAGIVAVPVTGRPAGWCDHITRMWPVTAVVGENGAFYSYMEKADNSKLIKKYLESDEVRKLNALRLQKLFTEILKKFPNAQVASDQKFREFDLAIDYCEDVSRWKDSDVQALIDFAKKHEAIAKLSSIHVNIWYGDYDKWTCVQRVLSELLEINISEEIQKVLYIGDSPNDEPFFKQLPLTVGVANVQKFLGKMESLPKYITKAEGGLGFAELVNRILNH